MFGLDSFWHWAVLLAVVVLLFGTGKLRNAGRDLGTAIAGFRKSMREGDPAAAVPVPLDKDNVRECR
ncbi:twin-arginine translocase TatA/TatE family subunit [Frateuria soli]|uniref:twin-arginine translocase TatA/TatE family subunit n=1 Tax=Frateuria soli TaxID=1542730 RepID=UPI001E3B0AE3|nr:twin-arginine translocase TatA/TatE family subunit [Frateuria soli]UGB37414.1 twin-arginine translocase TatA/TatE family subunit [Frateuria soli]